MRYPGYSFCIISGGHRHQKLQLLIDSIHRQTIPAYEIVVAGNAEDREDIIYIPMVEAARDGKITLLRNAAAERSKYEYIVFLDDDIVLTPGWIDGVSRVIPNTDLVATRLLNLDGTRHWDWTSTGGPRGQFLLDYEERDSFLYLPGGLIIAKAFVWESILWDPSLGYFQAEDVVFSRDAFMKGFKCQICTESTAIHNDERNTQVGRVNLRRSNEGAALWLTGDLKSFTPDQLISRAAQELIGKRMAEAVDCFRHALHKDPDCQPAKWQLAAIENYFGGPVKSGAWQPEPLTKSYGLA